MTRIAVTGSLAYDYISTYDRPFEEVLLPNQLDRLSVCFVVKDKQRHFGGTAGNIAYNLALLGETPRIVARAGYDFTDYASRLEALGIPLDTIHTSSVATASASIITDSKGHQISEFHPGAMHAPDAIDFEASFGAAEVLIISPDAPNRMIEYAQAADRTGLPYFFDPGQALAYLDPSALREAIDSATGLFLNEYEYAMLVDILGVSEAELLSLLDFLIVTRAEAGSIIYHEQRPYKVGIVAPESVLDPTGCGDAFRAGFLKAFVEGKDPATCGRWGALMATYNVEQIGTQNHRPGLEDIHSRFNAAFGKLS